MKCIEDITYSWAWRREGPTGGKRLEEPPKEVTSPPKDQVSLRRQYPPVEGIPKWRCYSLQGGRSDPPWTPPLWPCSGRPPVPWLSCSWNGPGRPAPLPYTVRDIGTCRSEWCTGSGPPSSRGTWTPGSARRTGRMRWLRNSLSWWTWTSVSVVSRIPDDRPIGWALFCRHGLHSFVQACQILIPRLLWQAPKNWIHFHYIYLGLIYNTIIELSFPRKK